MAALEQLSASGPLSSVSVTLDDAAVDSRWLAIGTCDHSTSELGNKSGTQARLASSLFALLQSGDLRLCS